MSTEYYSTKKILWRELSKLQLPSKLRWEIDSERARRDPTYVGALAAGADRVVVWTGDHYYLQGNDPDVAVFERFGANSASRVLIPLGEFFDCVFVSDVGSVLGLNENGEEDEYWDEELKSAAEKARGRESRI